MLNIIEHFWHFQVNDCRIVPTVIKVKKEKPKAYFYSEKQRRVLRKKDHSIESALDVLHVKDKPNQQFLLLKISEQNRLQPQLILESQFFELMHRNDRDVAIFCLQNDITISSLILCTLKRNNSVFEAQILTEKKQQDGVWSNNLPQELDQTAISKLKTETITILQAMMQKMKISDNLQIFQLIIGADFHYSSVRCIWCTRLSWEKPHSYHFYRINYDLTPLLITSSQQKQEPFKPQQKISMEPILYKKQEFGKKSPSEREEQINKLANLQTRNCRGCERIVSEEDMREVPNEDLIALRRKHRLSIIGVKEQYGLICHQCLQHLQQE